jgi:hypothetical protein
MLTDTPTAPRSRVLDALETVAHHYGTGADLEALRTAGDAWRDEAVAQLAEAVAALLIEIRPRTGAAMRKGAR